MRKLLRRSRTFMAARTLPSILKGFRWAANWSDLGSTSAQAGAMQPDGISNHSNPLSAYFDSVAGGRGIWKWRHYFDIYHRHLEKFVGQEVHMLEVGIYSGGSLAMWKDYFGPKCVIYGVDIEEACRAYEDQRTRIFIGDQADRAFWKRFRQEVPKLDVVIDDGGHLPEQQIVTLEETLPYLDSGGVYICEDIHDAHNRFAAYVHGLSTALNSLDLEDPSGIEGAATVARCTNLQRSVASVHHYPYVTVIEKTGAPADKLVSVKHGTLWQPFL